MGGCLLTGPGLLKCSDSQHLVWVIGISFFCRSLVFLLGFPFLPKPDAIITFVVVTAMLCFTAMQNVCVEAWFSKMIPSEIAGSLKGLFNFFG